MKSKWLLLALPMFLTGCGYNTIQTMDESAAASKQQIEVQLQRRADLVPNLVETVKGYAAQEVTIFTAVAEARAGLAGAVQGGDVGEMASANQAMTGALGRLLAISENYPTLKSDQNFLRLQDDLAGTENRIAVARNRYIKAVQEYNVTVRSFPSNLTAMMFGYKTKPNFTVENEKEVAKPPKVDFAPPPTK